MSLWGQGPRASAPWADTAGGGPPANQENDSDSWWAGAVNCMASIGIASLLAANALSAQLPVAIDQQQDELVPQQGASFAAVVQGPRQGASPYIKMFVDDSDFIVTAPTFFPDEDLWVIPLPQVATANRAVNFFETDSPSPTLDEDYNWTSGLTPVLQSYQRLPVWTYDQNENATGLYGVPEEEFWFIPKALPPIRYAPAITVDDDIIPATISVDDSDGWQNRVSPVPATLKWPDPSKFEQHENATGLYGVPEEDSWSIPRSTIVAPIILPVLADDEIVTSLPQGIVEDEGWVPAVPIVVTPIVQAFIQLDDEIPEDWGFSSYSTNTQGPRQSLGPYVRIFLGDDDALQPPPSLSVDETEQAVRVPAYIYRQIGAFLDDEIIVPPPPSLLRDDTDQQVYVQKYVSFNVTAFTDDEIIVPQPAPPSLHGDETDQQVYVPRYIPPQVSAFTDDEIIVPQLHVDETDQQVYVPRYIPPQVTPFIADDEIATAIISLPIEDEDFWLPPIPAAFDPKIRAFIQPEFEVPAILAFTPGANANGATFRPPRLGTGSYVPIFIANEETTSATVIPLLIDETDQQVYVPRYIPPQVSAFTDDDLWVPAGAITPLHAEDNDQPVYVVRVVPSLVTAFSDDDNWILPPSPLGGEGVSIIIVSDNALISPRTRIIADDTDYVRFVAATPIHVDDTDYTVIRPFKRHGIPPVVAFKDDDFVGIPRVDGDGLTIVNVAETRKALITFADDDIWVPTGTVTPFYTDDEPWVIFNPPKVFGKPPVKAITADDDFIPFVGDTADGVIPFVITSYSPLLTGYSADDDQYPQPTPLNIEELDWQVIPPPKVFGIPPIVATAVDDNYATPIIPFETDLPLIPPPQVFGVPPIVAATDDGNWVPFVAPNALQIEEDYWQNPVAPVPATFKVPAQWAYDQNEVSGTLGTVRHEEDPWSILRPQPPYVTTRAVLVDDEIVPRTNPLDSIEPWTVILPAPFVAPVSAFIIDDEYVTPIPEIAVEDDSWAIALPPQVRYRVWISWHLDELRHKKRHAIVNTGDTSIVPLLDGTTNAPSPGGGTSSINPATPADTSITPKIILDDTGV